MHTMTLAEALADPARLEDHRDLREIGDATFECFIGELRESLALRRALALGYGPMLAPADLPEMMTMLAR